MTLLTLFEETTFCSLIFPGNWRWWWITDDSRVYHVFWSSIFFRMYSWSRFGAVKGGYQKNHLVQIEHISVYWKNGGLCRSPFLGMWSTTYQSGQIIATSHDLTPNGGLVREILLFQGNLGWWNIIIWPDQWRLSIIWRFHFLLRMMDLQQTPLGIVYRMEFGVDNDYTPGDEHGSTIWCFPKGLSGFPGTHFQVPW